MPITPDEYTYPFDPTGTAPSNKVTGEVHVITQQNHRDYSFIIPTFAPFFAEGVSIIFTDVDGNPVPLVEGTDYYFGHHFLAASRAISKQVYGSISFITKDFKGTMSLSYQTLGGKWTYDQAYLNQLMTNIVSNPRSTSWDSIVELPALFPVIDHEWNLIDMVGMSHVVAGLFGIEMAIRDPSGTGTGGGSGSQLMNHILDNQNPHHTTKLQVGLGNVDNYLTATQAEAEAGIADNRFMTPVAVKQAITAIALAALTTHEGDFTNPHHVTASQVGLGNVQNYGIASQVEAEGGAVNNVYMTPLRVKQAIMTLASGSIGAHTSDFNNPHHVTATQVGAYTTAEVDQLLLSKLDTNGVAVNSSKLDNLTVAQLTTQILANKVDAAVNADKLGGMTYQDIVNSLTTGTSTNSMRLENKTLSEVLQLAAAQTVSDANTLEHMSLQQIYDSIPVAAAVVRQVAYDGVPLLSSGTELYTELFSVPIGNAGDVQLLFAGGGISTLGTDSYSYFLKANTRNGTLDVVNLSGIAGPLQFAILNPGDGFYHVWVKSELERQQISLTAMSNQFMTVPDVTPRSYLGANVPANVTVTQPANWVVASETNLFQEVSTHVGRTDNPHSVTKAQVGLSNVQNYGLATLAEAQAGLVNTSYMTPLRTADAIAAMVGTRTTTLETEVSQIMTDLTTLFNSLTV